MNTIQDRIRGSLVGGAIGDALGYPVEFMSRKSILRHFGEKGITRFELDKSGKALVSDDTQMTLFTANGLLNWWENENRLSGAPCQYLWNMPIWIGIILKLERLKSMHLEQSIIPLGCIVCLNWRIDVPLEPLA